MVAEEEEGGIGAGGVGVGDVGVVGEADERGGRLSDLGEGEGAVVGDGAEEGAPRVTLLGADAGEAGLAVDEEGGQEERRS